MKKGDANLHFLFVDGEKMVYCGVDIIEISRIENSIRRFEETFLDKIFTKNEIEYCNKYKDNCYEHYAVRFAAKEALYKAFSSRYELSWQDVEILNKKSGRPYVKFVEEKLNSRFSQEQINEILNAEIDITLSHNNSQAIAYVIVEI